MKIARVFTVPQFVTHTVDQINYLVTQGNEVVIYTSYIEKYNHFLDKVDAKVIYVDIERNVNLIHDIYTLFALYRSFRKEKFDIIHTMTPKAGLLGILAAFLAMTKFRIHSFTGQRWIDFTGVRLFFFKSIDKFISLISYRVLTDSISQRKLLIEQKIVNSNKLFIIGNGSLGGVNFKKNQKKISERLDNDVFRFCFLGRIVKDKGIEELITAFERVKNSQLKCKVELHLIGHYEESDPISERIKAIISSAEEIKHFGFVNNPMDYLGETDVLCLPSYREGFGTVVIEAAALEVPTIGTNIIGLQDAIINNETGWLVNKQSMDELYEKMLFCINNPDVVVKVGRQARERGAKLFSTEYVNSEVLSFYRSLKRS